MKITQLPRMVMWNAPPMMIQTMLVEQPLQMQEGDDRREEVRQMATSAEHADRSPSHSQRKPRMRFSFGFGR